MLNFKTYAYDLITAFLISRIRSSPYINFILMKI